MAEAHIPPEGPRAEPTLGPVSPSSSEDVARRPDTPRKPIRMRAVALIVLAGAAAVAAYLHWPRDVPPTVAVLAPAPATPSAAAPEIRYPIEGAAPKAEQAPLPSLQESDAVVLDALAGLVGGNALDRILQHDGIVRRIVATVDNLPRQTLAPRLMPSKPVPGAFVASGSGDALAISAANAARYAPYLAVVDAVDAKTLAALYVRFYPLFQQAYRDLGYPSGYFNDRLVEAIDDLLAAPVVSAPVRLAQPKVLYEYAEPALERRSAGQKMMLRMGSNDAARVKAKLVQFRRAVTGPDAKP